jgi:oxygen-independent coproporphyrinogen-3 oxidase
MNAGHLSAERDDETVSRIHPVLHTQVRRYTNKARANGVGARAGATLEFKLSAFAAHTPRAPFAARTLVLCEHHRRQIKVVHAAPKKRTRRAATMSGGARTRDERRACYNSFTTLMSRAGVYIHIPFCRARCSYCDFATGAYEGALAERYVRAVAREVEAFAHAAAGEEVDTVYFGGGTPSLLTTAQVARIVEAVRRRFRVADGAEVTLEMNPGTVTRETLRGFRDAGVNRASFGAQTFDERELKRLGRTHTADDTRRTLALLREAGFTNVSFDLIAGLPEQTLEAWRRNLGEALALRPEHLSLYLLEVHEGTPLADQIRQGRYRRPDPDTAAEMYRLMVERTREAGYEQYEISNFCLTARESRHNLKYWMGAPYYGFGCSAHSFDGRVSRWSNERDARAYVASVEEKGSAVVTRDELDARGRSSEALFLGLRLLRRGVNLSEYRARFRCDVRADYAEDLARFDEAGLIEIEGDVLRLTPAGALLSNEVFSAFV